MVSFDYRLSGEAIPGTCGRHEDGDPVACSTSGKVPTPDSDNIGLWVRRPERIRVRGNFR